MSTIRANAIVDSVGGNTTTVNGVTVALASQAEAQAGTDNTKLMTPLRAAQAITALAPAPTTAQVLNATAGAALAGVGTYALLGASVLQTTTAYNPGDTAAGSALQYFSVAGTTLLSGTSPAGTWRCMGWMRNAQASPFPTGTVWLRIS